MTNPLTFPDVTPRFGLPMLYAGQAQKEVTVNEAFAAADLLLQPAVLGERPDPPLTPATGDTWLVGAGATGDWAGHDGALAGWTGGGWRIVAPQAGMRVFDTTSAAFRLFNAAWSTPANPVPPQGGAIIDNEARQAIGDIVARLKEAGVFSAI
ncbi:MAG: DUF2793 domain-containing protein [Sphingomonadales bacterium]|nr:DUF2793 domain-containing protein [Sphingomonadales bacterium]MDE2568765.1 DUF2793 domain-containing protein [Sphingomonadales bacterium]